MSAANGYVIQLKRWMSAMPAPIISARNTSAPATPNRKHPALVLGGNVELGENNHEDEDVVDRQHLLEKIRGVVFSRPR